MKVFSTQQKSNTPKVFISQRNEKISNGLVKVLVDGFGLESENVFNSSSSVSGIPMGDNFDTCIKQKIRDNDVFICLITREYLSSQYCLYEAGYADAHEKKIFMLLDNDVRFEEIKMPLRNIQGRYIHEPSTIDHLATYFSENYATPFNLIKLNEEKDKFIKNYKEAKGRGKNNSIYKKILSMFL